MSVEPPLSLRERRRLRTREELVDGVLTAIARVGVADTTIDQISAESGVSRGTVYAHFPGGRDELLRAGYARLGTQLVERTRAEVSQAADWRSQLTAHARAMFELASDARLGHFFNVSGPALIPVGAERGIGSGASIAMIRDTLADAQRGGEVALGIDPEAASVLLVGAIREASTRVAAGGGDPERTLTAFERLLDGLAA